MFADPAGPGEGEKSAKVQFPQHAPAAAQQPSPPAQQAFTLPCLVPQQALPSRQQAAPSLQQAWAPEQQDRSLAQQPIPLAQQPSFASAAQQALPLPQQARSFLQQSACAGLSLAAAG